MTAARRDEGDVLREFDHWYHSVKRHGTRALTSELDCWFVPFPEVQNYLSKERIQRLLDAVFRDRIPHLMLEISDFVENTSLRVFCILLTIGQGHMIEFFCMEELQDHKLPFSISRRPLNYPLYRGHYDPNFWENFCEKQWSFCAASFLGRDVVLQKEIILPIVSKEIIYQGQGIALSSIVIHRAYNFLGQPASANQNPSSDSQNTFLLKTYHYSELSDAQRYYRNEIRGIRELALQWPSPSMIGFYGSFAIGPTYSLIFEHPDYPCHTLEDYFRVETPPAKDEDINKFWGRLLGLIPLLEAIHNLQSIIDAGTRSFSTWHLDVKPQNILVINSQNGSDDDCCFKFRFTSHLVQSISEKHGPQEIQREKATTSETSEIWFLGRVYSEAAIWLVLGYGGLLDYRKELGTGIVSPVGSHSSKGVSDAVSRKHERVQTLLCDEDYVTKNIIVHVINRMMEAPGKPPTISQLRAWSQEMLYDLPRIPPQSLLATRAREGDLSSIQKLIEKGNIDLNSKDDAGWTALAYSAVYRHKEVVNALLTHGAIPGLRTRKGRTTQELVQQRLKGANSKPSEEFKAILDLLETPRSIKDVENPIPQSIQSIRETWCSEKSDQRQVCDKWHANLRFYKDQARATDRQTIWDTIYNKKTSSKILTPLKNSQWIWFHLSANNKLWVQHLISSWYDICDLSSEFFSVNQFIENSYYEVPGLQRHAFFRRPVFDAATKKDTFSLVIPYFHAETTEYLDWKKAHLNIEKVWPKLEPSEQPGRFEKLDQLYTAYQNFGDKKLVYLHQPRTLDESYYTGLVCAREQDSDQVIYRYVEERAKGDGTHQPRTLDESYYAGLVCDREQDSDQVIYRFVEERAKGDGTQQEGAQQQRAVEVKRPNQNPAELKTRILMVSQLWLWKIGDVIITAFPEPGENGLLDKIQSVQNIKSLDDMIYEVVQKCIDFLDGNERGGLIENWLDIFERSIAKQSQKEAEYFKNFREQCQEPQKHENSICDQKMEMECLRETQDIRDELNMINRVLEDQRKAMMDFRRSMGNGPSQINNPNQESEEVAPAPKQKKLETEIDRGQNTPELKWEIDKWDKLLREMSFRQERVQKLAKQAEMVEEWVNKLLDLKQKQGNLNEARNTSKLAKAAEDRAKESETQNRLLWVFTIVTVFFTPLSFIAALFAIPTQQYPYNGSVNWKLWHIAVGMLVPEAITFLLILSYWGYIKGSKDTLSRNSEATPRSISPAEQKWWEKIGQLSQRNETKTNDGVPVTDTECSESPSANISDANVNPKRLGSLRSRGKKESDVDVSRMA